MSHSKLSRLIVRSTAATMRQPKYNIIRANYTGKVKTVIWDLGGTTADKHCLAPKRAFIETFQKYNIPITPEQASGPMGARKDIHIAQVLEHPEVRATWLSVTGEDPVDPVTNRAKTELVSTLYKDFIPIQLACIGEYSTLIDKVAETATLLRNQGIQIGTTTGFNKEMANILLSSAADQGFTPDSRVEGDTVPNEMGFRPAPFMIYQNMLNLQTYPIQAVVKVDDTNQGLQAAKNAGCWAVAVRKYSSYTNVDSMEDWNAMSEDEKHKHINDADFKLQESGCHYIIDTIADLPTVVEDINYRLSYGDRP